MMSIILELFLSPLRQIKKSGKYWKFRIVNKHFTPTFFLVYQVTRSSFTDDHFFKTGDAVTVDEDGYFVILGRKYIQNFTCFSYYFSNTVGNINFFPNDSCIIPFNITICITYLNLQRNFPAWKNL